MFWQLVVSIGLIQLLGVISPGPDFALIVRNATLYPKKIAIYTAFGIAASVTIHLTYCILGLALVIKHSFYLFIIIKYLGAFYLFYLGVRCWLAKPMIRYNSEHEGQLKASKFKAFSQGVLCNLLNPKATLFFLGLFTVVITPQIPLYQQVFIGAEITFITLIWFVILVLLLNHPKIRQKIYQVQPIIMKIMGFFLIVFSIELALTQVA